MVVFSLDDKNYLDFNDVVNDFIDFYQQINKDYLKIDKDINNEIELVIYNPNINILSTLYNYKNKQTISYIELQTTKKKDEENPFKLRKRINLNKFNQYNITNSQLLQEIDNLWEEKKLISDKNHKKNDISLYKIKYATEEKKKITPISYFEKKVNVYFVMSISIEVNCFLITFKLKKYLKDASNKNASLLNNFLNYDIKKKHEVSLSLEFEYIGNYKDDIMYIKDSLIKSICYTYGIPNINNFKIYLEPINKKLYTNMIDPIEIFDLNEYKTLITPKVDGETVYFILKSNICYLLLSNYLYILKSNINNKNIYLSGIGEFVKIDNKRNLYPFYFDEIILNNQEKKFNRYESFKIYNKLLDENIKLHSVPNRSKSSNIEIISNKIKYDDTLMLDIYFNKKDVFGPFDTKENLMDKIVSCQNFPYNFPSDGLIFIDSDSLPSDNKIEDKKYKQDNTIDVFARVSIFRGVYKNNNHLEIKLFKFKNNIKEEINTLNLKVIKDILFFDSSLTCLVFKKTEDSLYVVVPTTFIAEYSLLNKNIFPRIDKTNKYYDYGYKGNSYEIINKSLLIHDRKNIINIELFKELAKNYDLNFIDKIKKNVNVIKENEGNINILNNGKVWYKQNITSRNTLNLISNLNKTLGITNSIAKIITQNQVETVLSIYCGRGGDMMKYFFNGIKHMVGIDPDNSALVEYRLRHNMCGDSQKSKLFKLDLIETRLEDENFITKIQNVIGSKRFDVIDIQLGIHFSLSKYTAYDIMKKIKHFSKRGTKVLISTNDGDELDKEFQINNNLEFSIDDNSNIKFYITKKNEEKISVFYDYITTDWMDEYIIYPSFIKQIFKQYNYTLLDTFKFSEMETFEKFYSNLSEFPYFLPSSNRRSTSDFYKKLIKIHIEKDLKRLLNCYRFYCFEL